MEKKNLIIAVLAVVLIFISFGSIFRDIKTQVGISVGKKLSTHIRVIESYDDGG